MSDALVSVIIPAYNAAEFIGETLDSVFAQTFTRYEVIVVNDGSADTEALERVLAGYPSNLHYIKQENQGAAAARNTGLRASGAEFVAFLDADDTWLPEFLEKQMDFLERSNADFVFCDALLVGDTRLAGRTFMQLDPSRGAVTPENLLSIKVTILTSTVVSRRAPIIEVGLFDKTIRRGHDFDLWLRLAKLRIRFAYHNEVLAHHRIVESGLSGGTISQLQRTLAVLETIRAKGLTPSEEAALQFNMNRTLRELALESGKEKLIERDFSGARQSFNEAQRFRHSWKIAFVCLALRISPDFLRRIYHRRANFSV
ncbi:MAG TPA: glycosyltransferase family A protein [Pyrinomonadaceae bacterium]|nr:glycosyltransferase family A protein [Pyrinomonadaceae bacterium]